MKSLAMEHISSSITSYDMEKVDFTQVLFVVLNIPHSRFKNVNLVLYSFVDLFLTSTRGE